MPWYIADLRINFGEAECCVNPAKYEMVNVGEGCPSPPLVPLTITATTPPAPALIVETFCSSHQMVLPLRTLSVAFPWSIVPAGPSRPADSPHVPVRL